MCHKNMPLNCIYWIGMFSQMCVIYEITDMNYVTSSTVHIFDISLNKYGWHIANIAHKVNMLTEQTNPTSLIHMPKCKQL